MSNIKNVYNIEELIHYLKTKGENHNYYYHYTDWGSLEKIMKYGTFLVTRGNCLSINDQQEAQVKGSRREWDRTFIGSFSYGDSEIMAMWGLYCLPWEDAVRICIPKNEMNQWLASIDQLSVWQDNRIAGSVQSTDISLTDVVYVSGQSGSRDLKLTRAGKTINTAERPSLWGADQAPQMTGYIKNYAWQYENEVRIRIHLEQGLGLEKLCIKIPKEVLDAITVTIGPSFEYKNSNLLNQLAGSGRLYESDFKNLVKYRSLCSMCKHKTFLPEKE